MMKQNKGFIQIVILAVVTISALAYFNVDLSGFFGNPTVRKIGHIFVVAWTEFVKPLLVYLYTSIYGLFN